MSGVVWLRRTMGLQRPEGSADPGSANLRNMLVLIQLRWLAVLGQLLTILIVQTILKVDLPMGWLLAAPMALAVLNLVSAPIVRRRPIVSDRSLFLALVADVGALGWQLHFSGGDTNPFAMLFLVQVVLGALLLTRSLAWLVAAIAVATLVVLSAAYRPLALATRAHGAFFDLYLQGLLVSFGLVVVLLVAFVTRVAQNLKAQDAYLADLRQAAAEQTHIVRMGLLASGAAHELGSPLASLAVILSDWRRMPVFTDDPDLGEDIGAMQAEVERCKAIVTAILMSAGEARGEAPERTSVQGLLQGASDAWRQAHAEVAIALRDHTPRDLPIIADLTIRQAFGAMFDNAMEAGASRIEVVSEVAGGDWVVTVSDDGRGFPQEILESIGQPYRSTKARPGAGLGLFLLLNVLRTLGGALHASNRAGSGAQLKISIPLAALAAGPQDEEP